MKRTKLMIGDNIESLKKLPDNSIDSIVTDPPYGLSFMGKKWDYDVPSVQFWKEVWRVLKPGGHVLSFGGSRTYHRMVVNIEDAGFEIRDQIMWLYGSGFPKSRNIGKDIEKINVDIPVYEINNEYEGWGTALKPANEPICVARKPLSEKSVAENVLRWGTGGINVDGCRVGTTDTYNYKNGPQGNSFSVGKEPDGKRTEPVEMNSEGRFPANIILDEIAGELLDEQSGISKTKADLNYKHNKTNSESDVFQSRGTYTPREDKGGASRFFYQAKVSKQERNMGLDGFEEKEIGGLTKKNNKCIICGFWENKGAGNGVDYCKCIEPHFEDRTFINKVKNNHPTVKPVSLMAYLCRLVTPQGGIVLDPFMGSGSTGIAAQLEGFRFCGMEMDKDYFKIAEARIENYEQYKKFIK